MKKILSTAYSATSFSIGLFILRAGAGALMIPHGYDKLNKFNEYKVVFSDPFHIGTTASLSLSIFAEFFCAILIILGFLTRFACIPLMINMSVALFVAHHGDLFGVGEKAAIFLTAFTAILFTGPGNYSVDKMVIK
jgi:putative oxidoreductase